MGGRTRGYIWGFICFRGTSRSDTVYCGREFWGACWWPLCCWGSCKLIIEKLGSISWRSFTNFHLSKRSLVSTNQTRQLIESLIGDKQLDDCEIPFLPVLTNILSHREEASFTQSAYSLATIIQAAIAFPGSFHPFKWMGNGLWMVVFVAICRCASIRCL